MAGISKAGKILALGLAALAALTVAALLSNCGKAPPPRFTPANSLVLVEEGDWPLLSDDSDAESLRQAMQSSLAYLRKLPPDRPFIFGPVKVKARDMELGLLRFREIFEHYPDPRQRDRVLKQEFLLLSTAGRQGQGQVLMTGYYEPILEGRRRPQPPFVHPIYALPSDWVSIDLSKFGEDMPKKRVVGQVKGRQVVPYPDREAIDWLRAIEGKAKILAYVADLVEVFFLHIQGSGQVRFSDGERLRVGYAATNGQPYRSIGGLLLSEGAMQPQEMSMQGIKRYLAANPQAMRRVLTHNPSYVFFRPLSAQGGPLGCYNQPLTGGRSIATDRRLFPACALAYLAGPLPAQGGGERQRGRFVFNQDTGGAIRGPGRLDFFFGSGPRAGELAGRSKHLGRLYFLAPKPR